MNDLKEVSFAIDDLTVQTALLRAENNALKQMVYGVFRDLLTEDQFLHVDSHFQYELHRQRLAELETVAQSVNDQPLLLKIRFELGSAMQQHLRDKKDG